jgi:transposase-like protein
MKYRRYDQSFKEHAVNLWLASGKSAQEVAAQLDIPPDRLYTWKNRMAPDYPPAVPPVSELKKRGHQQLEQELSRLRRENQQLRQQRDILKKTLGILSDCPGSDTNALNS